MIDECVLVLDTCGERPSLALARGNTVLRESVLEERAASTVLLQAIKELLERSGLALETLTAIGVVNGPGSFTGLRVGLATAKGLSEAMHLPLAAVSRLAVLAVAGKLSQGWAVLRAGRNEVYARRVGRENAEAMLLSAEFLQRAEAMPVVYAEASLAPLLSGLRDARQVALAARDALPLVLQRLSDRGELDPSLLDANYVRNEQAIYKQKQVGQ